MIDSLNSDKIKNLVEEALNQGKKILYREGHDYRYSIAGSKRNKGITLPGLLHQLNNNFIELEKEECNDQQIVFHGYSCLDME